MTERPPSNVPFEALVEASRDGVFAFDRELRVTVWNGAMERLLGARRANVLGRGLLETFPFLRAIGEEPQLRGTLSGVSSVSRDRPFDVPETRRRGHFDAHYEPSFGKGGEIIGGHVVVRDVTDERRAEQSLRETESRFRTMADCAPVLLWMAGTTGECEYFNQVWLDFTGRTMDEEYGVGWAEGVHPEDFQSCVDTFMSAFNARTAFKMVYRLRRHDGAYRFILDNGVPRHTPSGVFAGFIGSCIDITDRVEADANREMLLEKLTRALEMREEFISVASHELRTPLTSLKLHTQRLQRFVESESTRVPDPDELARLAQISNKQVLRLEHLIDAMLSGTRLADERPALDKVELDLVALARDTIERFEVVAEAAGTIVTLSAPAPVTGLWDAVCLDRILVNLLMNAVKYGDGHPVDVTIEGADETVVLAVNDLGPGVAEADRRRIFDRFERAVSYSRISGLGLGLFVVKRLAEAHGGHVRVENRKGGGSSFVVELPRGAR